MQNDQMVKDPVCGMTISRDGAAGHSAFQGTTYYFCSAACKQKFDVAPASFAGGSARDGGR
jgi:P-type Cu+ transporter